uniref:RING-type E3 ubiquitin transferase n=1 Tax=Pohlia nutans TaxID=140635 RepID=A0A4Y6GSK0_9BRYO|nr:U-box armadillo repeat ubiquitin E3 ligase [Pohlia nutans]
MAQRSRREVRSKQREAAMADMSPPPGSLSSKALVSSLVILAQQVASCERPQVCQKRNVSNITRRIKLLSPLFEEIRDTNPPMPPSALIAFRNIYHVMMSTKELIDDCRESSTFSSVFRNKSISEKFNGITGNLVSALEMMPLELLEITDEVREQVELVKMQLQRAKLVADPAEDVLAEEVTRLLEQVERKEEPDAKQLQSLFARLELRNARDCEKEVRRLESELTDESEETLASATNFIGFVRYGKCILYGVTEMEDGSNGSRTSSVDDEGEVSTSGRTDVVVNPPDEFRCPISLDLMRDPVIVATGQTYDRTSIARWIEAGHPTCPKSGQKLGHVNLIPNYALRSLISQWCEDYHIPFDKPEKGSKGGGGNNQVASSKAALEATKMTASFLVGKLSTGSPDVQKQVAYELRLLAKCGTDNRMCIAEAGAIPCLVTLLSSKDPKTQENAVTALLNLSIYDNNKALIINANALDPIIEVLRYGGSMESRENAAATLFSLSVVDEYKIVIGKRPAAIPGLVALLRDGTPRRGKKDAASALFNLAVYHGNKSSIVESGAVTILVSLLSEEEGGIADDALMVLALVAGSAEGLTAIAEASAIPILVRMLRVGTPKGRENAIAVLLALCRNGGERIVSSVMQVQTAVPSLYSLLTMGTPRAKRKASSLLKLLQKREPDHQTHPQSTTHFMSATHFRQLATRQC